MKTTRILTAAALSLAVSLPATAEIIEAIVARVGDRVVTRSQYETRLREGYFEIEQVSTSPEEEQRRKKALKEGLLDNLLEELLIKDRADRLGITVTTKDVEDAVERLKVQYGIETQDQFLESLEQAGLTLEQMRQRLRDTLVSNAVLGRELRSRSEISDKELKARYEREKERYMLPERAELSEIVITIPEEATELVTEQRRVLAEEIANQAKQGVDFASLAKEFSQAPSKQQGGKLGTVAKGELIAEIDKPIFSADEGAILGPIPTRVGYHVVRVDKRVPAETPGFEAVKEKLRESAGQETFERDYEAYLETLRNEAFVVIYEANLPS
jgi:peptidyl-prolyl cis-trans isomerase SurA